MRFFVLLLASVVAVGFFAQVDAACRSLDSNPAMLEYIRTAAVSSLARCARRCDATTNCAVADYNVGKKKNKCKMYGLYNGPDFYLQRCSGRSCESIAGRMLEVDKIQILNTSSWVTTHIRCLSECENRDGCIGYHNDLNSRKCTLFGKIKGDGYTYKMCA